MPGLCFCIAEGNRFHCDEVLAFNLTDIESLWFGFWLILEGCGFVLG